MFYFILQRTLRMRCYIDASAALLHNIPACRRFFLLGFRFLRARDFSARNRSRKRGTLDVYWRTQGNDLDICCLPSHYHHCHETASQQTRGFSLLSTSKWNVRKLLGGQSHHMSCESREKLPIGYSLQCTRGIQILKLALI